ncbi:uncharacterized protein LOC141902288 [Tubulanus polymorphus]|uniref:uncharacterized protein LOC141902288 n=1 Tax=Tubulanus polymorphus TaxID=672921 RepID=UPI003DA1F9D1
MMLPSGRFLKILYTFLGLVLAVVIYIAFFYLRYMYHGMIDATDSDNAQRLTSIDIKDLKKLLKPYSIGSHVKILDVYETTPEEERYECVSLKTSIGTTPICIYPPALDGIISREIYSFGIWEPVNLKTLESILLEDRSLHFIDVGANLGVYTLTALKHLRKTVSVDANPINGMHLRRSVKLGGYESLSTIVINAVTDVRDPVILALPDTRNVGGATVVKTNDTDLSRTIATDAILMNDLLDVIHFDRAVLKMDIESSEYAALRYSEKIFQRVDIPYIFMEFRNRDLILKRKLELMGYTAYRIDDRTKPQSSKIEEWEEDVLWVKNKKTL